jgi:hypothetical protein
MGYVERELARIQAAIATGAPSDHELLMVAQQALSWALEPTGFASPLEIIGRDSAAGLKGCSAESRPPQS